MAESTQILFEHKEIVAMILRERGIHEGIWSLSVEFMFGAAMSGPTPEQMMPTALASIAKIGVQKTHEFNAISFSAEELNPRIKTAARSKKTPAK